MNPNANAVHGSCRVLVPYEPELGVLVVEVNETTYLARVVRDGGKVCTVQLRKAKSKRVYDVQVTALGFVCDCPDACYRHRKCKHSLALEALRKANKLGF